MIHILAVVWLITSFVQLVLWVLYLKCRKAALRAAQSLSEPKETKP